MPTKKTLLEWKNQLLRKNSSGRRNVIHSPFGVFSAESINDMLWLHTAKVIQNDVAEEIPWLNSNIQKPGMVANYPSPESVSKFKSLLLSPRYDTEIPDYGMTLQELSKVCCDRWISCNHILWIVKKLNSMKSSTLCVYLNFVGNIKRFVARRLQPDHPRPSSIVFILNVGKSPDGSVYLGAMKTKVIIGAFVTLTKTNEQYHTQICLPTMSLLALNRR